MRKILLALSILWSATSVAGLPPTTLGGEAGTAIGTGVFKVPNQQATKLTSGARIETGSKNLLVNPSFEHSTVTTGWTTTNTFTSPTSTITKEASINIQDGAGSLKSVFGGTSTGAWSIYQDTTLYASGKSGQDAEASVWIYSAATDVWLCPRTNGVTPTASIANGCVQYTNIGAPQKLTVFMLYGSTSTGFAVTGSTSSTTVYLDDAYLGDRRPQMQGITTIPDTKYTATFTGLGTVSPASNNCSYYRVANYLYGQCFITSGTAAASLQAVSIPSGLTIDASKIVGSGTTTSSPSPAVGKWQQVGANYFGSLVVSTATSTTNLYVAAGVTSSNILTPYAAGYMTSSVAANFEFKVPIAEWAGDNNAFTTKCDDPRNCETVFSTKVSSGGAVSNQSTGATYTWVGTCSLASSTYTCPISGFTVAPNCWITTDDSPSNGRLLSVTSSQVQILTYNTTSNAALVEGFTLSCQKQGADYTNAKISQQIIQMRGVPSVPGASGGVDTFSFTFGTTNATTACSANPCSYLDQIGNAVSSVGWASSGAYTLNTVKTYTKLKCTAAFGGTSGSNDIHLDQSKHLDCSNCNSLAFGSVSDSGAINTSGTLYCQGSY